MFGKANNITDVRALFTDKSVDICLQQAIETFLRLELIGCSENTREWYRRHLFPMSEEIGPDRPLASIMEIDLLEWYERLDRREHRYVGSSSRPEISGGLSVETKHGYVRAVKRFFKWLFKKGVLAADLSQDLKLPKLPHKRGKKGIQDGDASAIREAASSNLRDYALVMFIESTGVRRGGAAHLLLSDLNLDAQADLLRRRATVREKGNKQRVVVMTPAALEAMQAWLGERPDIQDQHVFLGKKPGGDWSPLTEAGISGVFRRYKEQLGITGRVSPHQWRHRWCRKLLQRGMGMKMVSQMAGHEDIAVTDMFYSDFDIDQLQEAFDKAADF